MGNDVCSNGDRDSTDAVSARVAALDAQLNRVDKAVASLGGTCRILKEELDSQAQRVGQLDSRMWSWRSELDAAQRQRFAELSKLYPARVGKQPSSSIVTEGLAKEKDVSDKHAIVSDELSAIRDDNCNVRDRVSQLEQQVNSLLSSNLVQRVEQLIDAFRNSAPSEPPEDGTESAPVSAGRSFKGVASEDGVDDRARLVSPNTTLSRLSRERLDTPEFDTARQAEMEGVLDVSDPPEAVLGRLEPVVARLVRKVEGHDLMEPPSIAIPARVQHLESVVRRLLDEVEGGLPSDAQVGDEIVERLDHLQTLVMELVRERESERRSK